MTAIKPMDTSMPLELKQEQDINIQKNEEEDSDSNDDKNFDDISSILSMPLPSIKECNCLIPADPRDDFLRLNTTVRAVYFSHLHKCLLSNYFICYKEKEDEVPCTNIKTCADQMELNAVRASLETSIYRQNMLKLISDIKSHTSDKKAYKNLVICLESPPSKVDVGVQTNYLCNSDDSIIENSKPILDSNTSHTSEKISLESVEITNKDTRNNHQAFSNITDKSHCNNSLDISGSNTLSISNKNKYDVDTDTKEGFNLDTSLCDQNCSQREEVLDGTEINAQSFVHCEDENSQDSLLQHMEDMFCDSDDSSDLTTLIEKHSGVTKANMDKEISNMCLDSQTVTVANANTTVNTAKPTKKSDPSQGKYSITDYKEMKNRASGNAAVSAKDTSFESKRKQRAADVWFVERVHRVSKLKAKMTELALKNYRKHGRVKEKFIELFGDSDDEEMMPDSPICIEDHLTACKERIAPWIVKYLMPFYKKRRIKDRYLFKVVAKHITDMLILENTFPEEACVNNHIHNYFRNKKFIKTVQDIYV